MLSTLSNNEKLVLWGLVAYPDLSDLELSKKLDMHYSTFCTVRKRLQDNDFYRTIRIPVMQKLGSEMLAVVYTLFNPAISVKERARITTKTIEVFEELFFSVGETHKGFSLNIARGYADVCRINDIRIETFAKAGLLDAKHPTEVIFPFEISRIPRFFDFDQLLAQSIDLEDRASRAVGLPPSAESRELGQTEKVVLQGLIDNPDTTDKDLAERLGLSRHTFSKARKMLESEGFVMKKRIPNLLKLGFKVMAISHIMFNPKKPMDDNVLKMDILQNPSTVLLAARKYECVTLSVYMDYEEYREDHTRRVQFLKESDYLADMPNTSKYMIPNMVVMKDMVFGPMVKKTLRL